MNFASYMSEDAKFIILLSFQDNQSNISQEPAVAFLLSNLS